MDTGGMRCVWRGNISVGNRSVLSLSLFLHVRCAWLLHHPILHTDAFVLLLIRCHLYELIWNSVWLVLPELLLMSESGRNPELISPWLSVGVRYDFYNYEPQKLKGYSCHVQPFSLLKCGLEQVDSYDLVRPNRLWMKRFMPVWEWGWRDRAIMLRNPHWLNLPLIIFCVSLNPKVQWVMLAC